MRLVWRDPSIGHISFEVTAMTGQEFAGREPRQLPAARFHKSPLTLDRTI